MVYPIPYVAEAGWGDDNTPLPHSQQKEASSKGGQPKLGRSYTTPDGQTHGGLAYDQQLQFTPESTEDQPGRDSDEYEHFLMHFPKVIDHLVNEGKLTASGGKLSVIIVSHSGYMRDNLKSVGCNWPNNGNSGKPLNNEVWSVSYKFAGPGKAMEPNPDCKKLMENGPFEFPPTVLCEQDVDRCGNKPTYWLNKDKKKCASRTQGTTGRGGGGGGSDANAAIGQQGGAVPDAEEDDEEGGMQTDAKPEMKALDKPDTMPDEDARPVGGAGGGSEGVPKNDFEREDGPVPNADAMPADAMPAGNKGKKKKNAETRLDDGAGEDELED
eukprot:TRINITY_DN4887_c0_g1_i7.p2 TRINITY_DN4887_c0_g1~~TRINITY_DN4887_c0_g1_i7.p2  ORF type:complete len:380 (-),score=91.55 TRINITY_DN4887_c0_g1_i7:186-1163(-)